MKKIWFALLAVIVAAFPVYASSVPEISKLPEVIPIQDLVTDASFRFG